MHPCEYSLSLKFYLFRSKNGFVTAKDGSLQKWSDGELTRALIPSQKVKLVKAIDNTIVGVVDNGLIILDDNLTIIDKFKCDPAFERNSTRKWLEDLPLSFCASSSYLAYGDIGCRVHYFNRENKLHQIYEHSGPGKNVLYKYDLNIYLNIVYISF